MMKEEKLDLPSVTLFSLAVTKRLVHALQTDADIAILKGATLLYSKVVLNTVAGPFESIYEFVAKGLTHKQKQEVRDLLQPGSEYPSYIGAVKNSQFLKVVLETVGANRKEIIRRFLEREKRYQEKDPFFDEDPFTDPDPLLVLYLTRCLELPYYDSLDSLSELQSLFAKFEIHVSSNEPVMTGIPNLGGLDWESILELRKSPFIIPFREFVFTRSSANADKEELAEKIDKALWEVIGMTAPSPTGSILQRILANAPIPGIPVPNPYAIYRDTKEGREERNLFKKYGWLFFFQQARTLEKSSAA